MASHRRVRFGLIEDTNSDSSNSKKRSASQTSTGGGNNATRESVGTYNRRPVQMDANMNESVRSKTTTLDSQPARQGNLMMQPNQV